MKKIIIKETLGVKKKIPGVKKKPTGGKGVKKKTGSGSISESNPSPAP